MGTIDQGVNQIMRAEIQGLEISEKKAGLAADTGWRRSGQWFLAPLPEPRMEMNSFGQRARLAPVVFPGFNLELVVKSSPHSGSDNRVGWRRISAWIERFYS